MKDIQGIQRGKCNSPGCECEEYRTSPSGESSGASGKFRCEYCDHTPVQHVKIIELGACKSCGKDNCEKYEFDDPNSYSNCAYCDCPANVHEGAEKLRKPQPQPPAQMVTGPQSSMMSGIQPRMNTYGQPAQTFQLGQCKMPGCSYPKRREGNKVHEFCSRTCANKYSQLSMQGGPGAQLIRGHMSMGGPQGPGPGQMMGQGPPASNTMMTSGSSMSGGGGMSSGGHGGGSGSGQPTATAVATYRYVTVVSKGPGQSSAQTPCKKCGVQPANPGHAWCQSCFQQQS